MNSIVGCHVIDKKNIGDLLSSPLQYFPFDGFTKEFFDIREVSKNPDFLSGKHIILGGGGLAYKPFFAEISALKSIPNLGKLIVWGIGQQFYEVRDDDPQTQERIANFDYSILSGFDLIGIRDREFPFDWVPCASCLHEEFDRPRQAQHDFVVFSHKKFCIEIENFPRMTNECNDFKAVLDFLGSGETVLTSSYHGAYWSILLGKRVIAFPFSSKFYTLKHAPVLYPVNQWKMNKKQWWNRFIGENKDTFGIDTSKWRDLLPHCRSYPESLQECRGQNRYFYTKVLEIIEQ